MKFLKRIFGTSEKPTESWTMFSSSKKEVKKLMISSGVLKIDSDFLQIKNYPFQPSIVFRQPRISKDIIVDIDPESHPPTIRIKNELIFLTAEKREELNEFALRNNLVIVKRSNIWGWILEPFLDTSFTEEDDQRTAKLMGEYGLTKDYVRTIREEVKIQMLKYNFDTMLWEWGLLNALDVLKAMRTKYDKNEFEEFYHKVMRIALLTKENNHT